MMISFKCMIVLFHQNIKKPLKCFLNDMIENYKGIGSLRFKTKGVIFVRRVMISHEWKLVKSSYFSSEM